MLATTTRPSRSAMVLTKTENEATLSVTLIVGQFQHVITSTQNEIHIAKYAQIISLASRKIQM